MSEKKAEVEPKTRHGGIAGRVTTTARNVAEVVRFGGLETGEAPSPYTVESEHLNYRLRHYFAEDVADGAMPILLVPPLMLTTEVWDVSPRASAVGALHEEGIDTWVVDFGHPDRDPGGLQRDLTDHVLAVSEAIDFVREKTGRDVILSGYSQGGMFAYQTAAFRRNKGIDSIVTFGSPVDANAPLPIPLSPEAASRLAGSLIDSGLFRKLAVPGWFSRTSFKLLTPAKSVQDRVRFLFTLHDRDALLPRERQRQFLENNGWTAWSGPAVAQFLEMYFQHNRMLEGGFVIDERLVTLADIDLPVLTVVGSTDTIGHPDSVRAIQRAAPSAAIYELTLRAGHFGLVVGSTAMTHTWPAVAAWARWRSGTSPLPESIVPAEDVQTSALRPAGGGASALTQATELGLGASRLVLGTARRAVRIARSVVTDAPAQLPRLQRIGHLDPSTRISIGLLLDEQARRNANEICFLFGDRAHRQSEVKYRVDSVVKGLISVGVHSGDRVGVLMSTRPSAFTVIAAISRLGATAVLLRPDGDVAREARLGAVTTVISDPEHVDAASKLKDVRCCVLGGGADERELPGDVIDMERIDPDDVSVPAWYQPNPQRAGDAAFVLFTGDGTGTRAVKITNRRWALSALGTASAAALRPGDTVYSVTPLYHSSALLMSIGGAVAGGARFAIALALADDADTFWDEVRRYGATHVSYTWTSLRAVVDAPQHPNERFHPIRMFMGSGMPRNLWKRTSARFPDAKVLEFYASAEGEAILANLSGQKPGSMGRPLPGTAEVRVAAFDLTGRTLKLASDGLARECLADEIGLLLTRVPDDGTDGVQRDVFAPGDAWRSTNDLFLRDEQGEHWLVGATAEIVDTARGPVLPAGTRFCLGAIPAVDLLVAYGVNDGDEKVVVGAVTLRADMSISAADLDSAMDRLPRRQRPRYVQVVPSIPLTTWHRPKWRDLQKRGVPKPTRTRTVWRLDDDSGRYQQL